MIATAQYKDLSESHTKKGPGRKHSQGKSRTVSVGKKYPGTHRPYKD